MRLKQIILIILISVSSIFAQDIGTTKVTVIEGFQPTIPEATRLNENATFADTIRRDRTQEYKMIHVNIDSDYMRNAQFQLLKLGVSSYIFS